MSVYSKHSCQGWCIESHLYFLTSIGSFNFTCFGWFLVNLSVYSKHSCQWWCLESHLCQILTPISVPRSVEIQKIRKFDNTFLEFKIIREPHYNGIFLIFYPTITFLSFHLVLHLRTILRKQNDAVTQNILSICFLWIKWKRLARGKNDIPIFMKNINFWKGVNPIEYFYYNFVFIPLSNQIDVSDEICILFLIWV